MPSFDESAIASPPVSDLATTAVGIDEMPDHRADPMAFEKWALSPAGQEFFAAANRKLMEERLNAEAAGSAPPSTVTVQSSAV